MASLPTSLCRVWFMMAEAAAQKHRREKSHMPAPPAQRGPGAQRAAGCMQPEHRAGPWSTGRHRTKSWAYDTNIQTGLWQETAQPSRHTQGSGPGTQTKQHHWRNSSSPSFPLLSSQASSDLPIHVWEGRGKPCPDPGDSKEHYERAEWVQETCSMEKLDERKQAFEAEVRWLKGNKWKQTQHRTGLACSSSHFRFLFTPMALCSQECVEQMSKKFDRSFKDDFHKSCSSKNNCHTKMELVTLQR